MDLIYANIKGVFCASIDAVTNYNNGLFYKPILKFTLLNWIKKYAYAKGVARYELIDLNKIIYYIKINLIKWNEKKWIEILTFK